MTATGVHHAILTSYEHTLFLVRDENEPGVVYVSELYNEKRSPLILYFTAFLALAGEPSLLADHSLNMTKLDGIRIHHERAKALLRRKTSPNTKYGILDAQI